jgi:hypothetical protein
MIPESLSLLGDWLRHNVGMTEHSDFWGFAPREYLISVKWGLLEKEPNRRHLAHTNVQRVSPSPAARMDTF